MYRLIIDVIIFISMKAPITVKSRLIRLFIIGICFSVSWTKTAWGIGTPAPIKYHALDTPLMNTDVYLYGTYTKMVPPRLLRFHVGEIVYTQGVVLDALIDLHNAVLLNLGVDSQNQPVTIVIKNKFRVRFAKPEVSLAGKTITVLGKVYISRSKAYMELSDIKALQVSPTDN